MNEWLSLAHWRPGMKHILSAVLVALQTTLLWGCTVETETNPARTATEQLLISAAIDKAAHAISINLPSDQRVYLEPATFEGVDVRGADAKYTFASVQESLLRQGIDRVPWSGVGV